MTSVTVPEKKNSQRNLCVHSCYQKYNMVRINREEKDHPKNRQQKNRLQFSCTNNPFVLSKYNMVRMNGKESKSPQKRDCGNTERWREMDRWADRQTLQIG